MLIRLAAPRQHDAGTVALCTILAALEPRKTRSSGPRLLEPTATISPSFHATELKAVFQVLPSAIAAMTGGLGGNCAMIFFCARWAWVRHWFATMFSA